MGTQVEDMIAAIIRLQHGGRKDKFVIPETPRFRCETKLRHAVSIVPGIEIVNCTRQGGDYTVGGVPIISTVMKIGEKHYAFRAGTSDEFDKKGNQLHEFIDGKRRVKGKVWENVCSLKKHFDRGDTIYATEKALQKLKDKVEDFDEWMEGVGRRNIIKLEDYNFKNINDPITQTIMEYLSVNKEDESYLGVSKIIFSADEPIRPKIWEVIANA